MKRILLLTLFVSTLLLSGCVDYFNYDDDRMSDFRRAERKWRNSNIVDYDYKAMHNDPWGLNGRYMVKVRNGVIVDAYNVNTGNDVPSSAFSSIPTIDDLFDYVYTAIDENYDELEVIYDPDLGFPGYIYMDRRYRAYDDEYSIDISDLYLFFTQDGVATKKISR